MSVLLLNWQIFSPGVWGLKQDMQNIHKNWKIKVHPCAMLWLELGERDLPLLGLYRLVPQQICLHLLLNCKERRFSKKSNAKEPYKKKKHVDISIPQMLKQTPIALCEKMGSKCGETVKSMQEAKISHKLCSASYWNQLDQYSCWIIRPQWIMAGHWCPEEVMQPIFKFGVLYLDVLTTPKAICS